MQKKHAILAFLFLIGAWCIFWSVALHQSAMRHKALKTDYAEINKVNYELLNVNLWKSEALDIMQDRIKGFTISEETYQALDQLIENYIDQLYQDFVASGKLVDLIIEEVEKGGGVNKMMFALVKGKIKSELGKIDLQQYVPGISDHVIAEIRANEPMIRKYMQRELLQLVLDDTQKGIRDRRQIIYARYEQADLADTETYLKESIQGTKAEIWENSIWLLCGIFLFAVAGFVLTRLDMALGVLSLTLLSVLLLILGISLPMIDIDARLSSFSFELLGRPISFDEQVVYFQSKSILEVTKVLWLNKQWDLQIVGILVTMFSVVFPFLKLILSAIYLFNQRLRNKRWVKKLIFYLGKWSMADVFVVAIFMSYIGMYGILSTQLAQMEQNKDSFFIETINYSQLSPGALYFILYTLLSIVIGLLLNGRKQS